MKTIYKYQLYGTQTVIEMPVGASILFLQLQDTVPTIWALVDQDQDHKVPVTFYTYGTGWDVPESIDARDFVGTYKTPNGYVFHVFKASN